ncbi:lipopolysaccharide biosynthesis protein [Rhodobacteraceae bacterium RKSG542]|uniref:lipopolysaccharide biosynthesis protein n=1 Tax=Pseudovibrio flavus TaxID=2529854 RepID=UPI0012BBA862|nr:lipopolysaccharide biosynthesis protein [Pseudovibrio flavus]MTI16711.1 lipopolysaccharide biosynthesis protein [Pseudovibrio flavus]
MDKHGAKAVGQNASASGDAGSAQTPPPAQKTASGEVAVQPSAKAEASVKQQQEKLAQAEKELAKTAAAKKGGLAAVVPLPVKNKKVKKEAKGLWQKLIGVGLRPQQKRRRAVALSFALAVLLPALLGTLYFAFIASDRYSASVGFAVRGVEAGAVGGDFLGALTGVASSGSTTTDSYILMDYLRSREVVERLSKDMGLREHYSDANVDFLYRLDPAIPIEGFVGYWDWMINTSFDSTSSIITVEVEAFSADEAFNLASLVLNYSEGLVNTLSENVRRDAVRFAEEEVSRAELRLRMIRGRMREFRENKSALDPTKNAEVQIELVAQLERQLIDTRSRLATLVGTIDESSPTLRQLRKQEAALLEQITLKQAEIAGPSGHSQAGTSGDSNGDRLNTSLSSMLASYEELLIEQEFAQQAYTAAMAGLERSRAEADRQQRYLAVFQAPSKPETAIYPRRTTNSLLLFGVLLALWSLGLLLTYSIRDHLR